LNNGIWGVTLLHCILLQKTVAKYNIVYARAYGHLISFYMIFAKDVMGDLGASAISLIKWTDFLMLIDLPIIFILVLKLKNTYWIKKKNYLFYVTVILSLSLICIQFSQLENSKMLGNYELHPLIMSPIGNHMFDIYRFAYEKGDILDREETETIDSWLEYNLKYQEPEQDYADLEGLIKGKNVIVIQFESLENIMVNKSYYGQEITPNINGLLDSSIYFSNIVEQVRDGNSSDAELLFNTSIFPMNSGSAFLRFGENTYVSLPNLLNDQGYISIAIHGDNKEFWNRDWVFPTLGFNKYIDEDQFDDKNLVGMGISDESLFKQLIKEIKKLQEPYNIFIITLTSHMPFTINKEIQYLDLPNDDVSSDYLQSIHYTDNVLGEFYNQLEHDGLLDNSILILYGDHEGIHKYYETTLSDNNYEVPFIIHVPGMKGFEVDKIGGQIDMMPTVAYLLGIENEKYASVVMGRNLFGKYSGSGILPTGKVIRETDDINHLKSAIKIADMRIRGNYFKSN
ncbi:MAG: LTA synthase family protein, partial [Proteocatella sp.]